MVIVRYCDRCKEMDASPAKPRVKRVTWEPLARTMDLCGDCRSDLQGALDRFLEMRASGSPPARADVEEALWCLKDDPPLKIQRPDTASFFLRRALKTWTEEAA